MVLCVTKKILGMASSYDREADLISFPFLTSPEAVLPDE